jgi:hypothetical protein
MYSKCKYRNKVNVMVNERMSIRKLYLMLDVVKWSRALDGRKAKRMVLQCINGVGSNPVEGRTKI